MTNIFKVMFMTTLVASTLISISSYSWLGTWAGLEINLISFIPLMKNYSKFMSSESMMKYFLVQALSSSIFMFSIIMVMISTNMMNEMMMKMSKYMIMVMNSTLMMKMGAAPFHFWFPEIVEGLSWMTTMILMTWQKIAPMVLLSYLLKNINFIIIITIMATFIGSIGGLNQTSLQKIITYSSINHIGWMIGSFLINKSLWIIYFLIYSFIIMTLIIQLTLFNLFKLSHIFTSMSMNSTSKNLIFMNLLSLGGLPPFLGFLPKWLLIQNMNMNFQVLILFMIMMSLVTLYFYLRIYYSSMMFINYQINFYYNNKMNQSLIMAFSAISITGMVLFTTIFSFF